MYNESMELTDTGGDVSDQHLVEFCRVAARPGDWKQNLDELVHRLRNSLIFDNIVLYQTDFENRRLEAIYARALGRGRSAEADSNWGESIAAQVAQDQRVVKDGPCTVAVQNRLNIPCLLGIPLLPVAALPGSLIFIRFGGPDFTAQDLQTAQFAAQQVNSLVARKLASDLENVVEDQKNAARLQEEFIHTISHELRSPLGFIKGYVTTLLREDIQWDHQTQIDFLNIIDRETNNLEDLFDNLLDSARLQSGQLMFDFQAVRVDSLIRDEVNRAQLNHPELEVVFNFESDVPPIVGDPRRLSQVFDNLLSNSIKYASGAPVKFEVSHDPQYMTILYSNSGPGIPEPYLSKIFTRFYRTPDQALKAHGSGLGLYICKQIIEQHHGTMGIASPLSGGVSFTITLPMDASSGFQSERELNHGD
jgi:signal transduction histidine kinase